MNGTVFSFIVVTYNNGATIEACLRSIAARTSDTYEVIVVDNSPDEHTVAVVEEFQESNSSVAVRVVKPGENIGFSRACNAGGRLASGEFLFFLNPDTQLVNDAAGLLATCLKRDPHAVAAGPAISDEAGRITRTCRNLPSLSRVFLDSVGLDNWCGFYKLIRFRHDVPKRVEQIIGAAILVRRADFHSLGGMDERFFIYFEEVDLCKRLRDAGGEIWFWPEARVQHLAGISCEAASVRARMIYTLRESRKKYFRKHFGVLSARSLEVINRFEGLQKAVVLAALWMIRRNRNDRDKAHGFWSVAVGVAPRT